MVAPRTVCPEDNELIELGIELVEWAIAEPVNKKDLRIRFPQWYSLVKGFTEPIWDLMKRKPAFVPYYNQARTALATRYMNGSISDSIAHRFIRIYFPEVKADENELITYKANAAAQAIQSYTQDDCSKLDLVLQAINAKQGNQCSSGSSKPTRSEADSSNSTDIKS
jgi:hypothetical protein